MAEEKLIIDISTRDSLTPALDKTGSRVKTFSEQAEQQFGKVRSASATIAPSIDKAGESMDKAKTKAFSFADSVTKKFEALGKAAVGIFAADVVAKVFGFSSALDAVNKASQAVADSIRNTAIALADKLKPALADTAGALAKIKELQDSLRGPSFTAPLALTATQTADIDLSQFQGNPAALRRALDLVERANRDVQRTLERQRQQRQGGLFGPGATTRAGARSIEALDAPIFLTFDRLISDLDKLAASLEKTSASTKAATSEQSKQAEAALFNARRTAEAQRQIARLGFGRAEGVGLFAGETPAIPGAGQIGAPGSFEQSLRASRAARGARALDALRQRNRAGVGLFAGETPEIAQAVAPATELADQLDRVASFSEQAQTALDELGRSIQSSIGSQAVFGAFNALSSFFERAIQGQATLRDLGRSFVALGAQILSQQAAFRLLSFLFPSFIGGGGVGAVTGGGGFSRPGFAGSGGGLPLPLLSGGGGGSQVAVSLNVASLDPRNAAQVILEQMPAIQRGLAAAIVSGQSRNLRMAVGSV